MRGEGEEVALLLQRARRAFLGKFAGFFRDLGRQAVLVLVEVLDRHDIRERFCVTIAISLQLADGERLVGGVLDLVFEAGIVGALVNVALSAGVSGVACAAANETRINSTVKTKRIFVPSRKKRLYLSV